MNTDHQRTNPDKEVGYTNTLGKGTLPKSHILIETLGNLDEANSMIGFARSQSLSSETAELLLTIQKDLGVIMAQIATVGNDRSKMNFLSRIRLTWLENKKEEIQQTIKLPKDFIYPGETTFSAILDMCRTAVRKAERRFSEVYLQKLIDDSLSLQYLNTLSQLLFLLELRTLPGESTLPDRAIQK
jgi:cob(I)alamin adenosyltransferase